jgi:hypothetical protein
MDATEPVTAFARVAEYLRARGAAFGSPAPDVIQYQLDAGVIAMRGLVTPAGSEWIAISVPLGPASEFRVRAALVANDELAIGALADWQGLMLLRQTLPLRSLTFAQLDAAVAALAHAAAQLAGYVRSEP